MRAPRGIHSLSEPGEHLLEKPSFADWTTPCREIQPPSFVVQHPLGDWSKGLAKAQDIDQLAGELAKVREQFAEQFSEIRKWLSQGRGSPLRRRKARQSGARVHRRGLPILPRALSALSDQVRRSQVILNRPRDPSDDLALTCSQGTWERAINILVAHANSVWKHAHLAIRPPVISAGPDGSVDLYWTSAPYGLLINVPADPDQSATYYGDDSGNPDSNRVSGKLDLTKQIDPGVLMWLAYTAQR